MTKPTPAQVVAAMEAQRPMETKMELPLPQEAPACNEPQQGFCACSRPSIASLYAALAKARGEFPEIPRRRRAIIKIKTGGQYSYLYADLADILHATTPSLSKNGLGIWQDVTSEGVVTTVYHESGVERRGTPWPIKPMPQRGLDDCQSYQSAVQVSKRYSLQAALGISTEETIEGDKRERRTDPELNDKFETEENGVGVRNVAVPKDATPAQKARAYADGIIAQLRAAKTPQGVDGVWTRNELVIDRLMASYPVEHGDVLDTFTARMRQLEEDQGIGV